MRDHYDKLTRILQDRLMPGWSAETFTSYDGQRSLVVTSLDERSPSYVATLSPSGFSLAVLAHDEWRQTHHGLSLDALMVHLDRLTSVIVRTSDRAA